MDRLLGMEVFVAVVEAGSMTGAAGLFGISAPMVGKHLRELEQRLGMRLLARTTRRQSLTEAGQMYYRHCKSILAEVRLAEEGVASMLAAPRGQLRISAPVTLGSLLLAPVVADYLAKHENVSVDLSLNDRVVDIVEEGFDLALRIGELPDSGLVARQLAPYEIMICASPKYLGRMGTPKTPEALREHQCLGFTHWDRRGGWRGLRPEAGSTAVPPGRFQSNNGQALRIAALKGFGIVMQPVALLADDVRAGRLVEILEPYRPKPKPVHLLYPRDRQAAPKLTSFIDFALPKLSSQPKGDLQ